VYLNILRIRNRGSEEREYFHQNFSEDLEAELMEEDGNEERIRSILREGDDTTSFGYFWKPAEELYRSDVPDYGDDDDDSMMMMTCSICKGIRRPVTIS
jgi:hypothetical protein